MIPPYSPSNAIIERVRQLFKKRVNDGALAFLGDSDGAGARVDVPGRPGYVYARWPDGRDTNGFALYSQPFMVRSSGVAYPNTPGAAVYVAVRYNNELEIVSANYAGLDRLGVNTAVLNPLNQQSKWVYPWQLTMGLASAVATAVTTSTLITVKSFRHYVADTFNTFETPLQADKIDLASYIPAADMHCYAAVWIDTYTNLPVVTVSTAQAITTPLNETDLQELIVTTAQSRPADGIPLKAFYLANAQTKVTQNTLDVDLRQILNNPEPWGFPNVLTTLERVWPNRTLVSGPYTTSGVGGVTLESGAQHIIVHKSNMDATTDPGVGDDSGDGYSVGSLWFNTTTDALYVATDVSVGAAVWEAAAGASGGITQLTGDGTAGPGSGSQALTLATVNANVGSFTNASITVNGKGLITAASSGTGGITQLTGDVTAGPGSGSAVATIPANTITQSMMTDNSVGTAEIIDENVTLAKLADGTPFLFVGYDSAGSPAARDATIDTLGDTGESWTALQLLYLDEASNTWFKIDNDSSPIKIGSRRGVALTTETHPATNVRIREYGLLDGFTGLTPGAPIYSSTTAGVYTQTTPAPVYNDFTQTLVNEMGYAQSAAQMFVDPQPLQYTRYLALLSGDETTIVHHADPSPRKRVAMATVSESDTSLVNDYASSNQDVAIQLQGISGTITVDATGVTAFRIGNLSGTNYRMAQSFTVTGGRLTGLSVRAGTTVGTPSQLPAWRVETNNAGVPSGTALSSGTYSAWTQNANNVEPITNGTYLLPGVTYWFVLEIPIQTSGNYYNIIYNSSGAYAGAMRADTTAGAVFPGTWASAGASNDMRCAITVSAVSEIGQVTSLSTGVTVARVRLWLKRTGSPTGALTLTLAPITGGEGGSGASFASSDAVSAASVGTSYGWIDFIFPINFTATGGTTTGMYLTTTDSASNTDYIEWGADGSSPSYTGKMTTYAVSFWRYISPDTTACFEIYGVDDWYDTTATMGRWGGSVGDLAARYDDGAGSDQNTNTTYKNISAQSLPVILRVQF